MQSDIKCNDAYILIAKPLIMLHDWLCWLLDITRTVNLRNSRGKYHALTETLFPKMITEMAMNVTLKSKTVKTFSANISICTKVIVIILLKMAV